MRTKKINYTVNFERQFKLLPLAIKKKAIKAENIFRKNPFYPSLRLHKLKGKLNGLWSISLDIKNRIIFKPMDDGVMLFISIGTHAIYDNN